MYFSTKLFFAGIKKPTTLLKMDFPVRSVGCSPGQASSSVRTKMSLPLAPKPKDPTITKTP